MYQKKLYALYLFFDVLSSMIAWTGFFFLRKVVIERRIFGDELHITPDNRLAIGLLLVPLFWVTLYHISGYYNDPVRKSRLKELGSTLLITTIGTVLLFFTLILDDFIGHYTNYYFSFFILFLLQFILIFIPRYLITTRTVKLVHSGRIGFNTIIIGGNGKATAIFRRITEQKISSGNRFIGFVNVSPEVPSMMTNLLPELGPLEHLGRIIDENEIEEVIIAIEPGESETLGAIINLLNGKKVIIKAIPGMHDILLGRVKMSAIFDTPLILIGPVLVPRWQSNIKQIIDFSFSAFALVLLLPLSLVLSLLIAFSGKGPVIFRQERIGMNGKPFFLYKFRSMYHDAEKDGPSLSGVNDKRITPVGRFMRRHRLDEIPNFINVLKGEMSLVGPRPEREHYINQILEKAPQYRQLLKIKPGITSWGQVKYGYASNIDQMIERLEYDLIYLENMSLYVDLKIAIYTLITVIRGSGI